MANQVVNRNVSIFIESGQAQRAFDALIKKEKELKEALDKATNPKQAARLKEELDKLQEPLDRAKRKLSGELSPGFRDVQATVNSLGNRLKRMSSEDADFSKVVTQYRQANAELEQQRGKIGLLGRAMQSFFAQARTVAIGVLVGNTIQSALQTVLGYVTGIVTGSAKISDELADIQRITGLTKGEVREINSELKKIDTRTSTSALRDIAIVAGKLGIEGKENIVSFVTAVDKLNIALGGELGDIDAFTTDLGKILNVFEGKITGENITAVGNAIVDLANKGVATGPFLVDFTQRMAGVAKTAGLSLNAVIGFAAGMEETGQKVESSSTALTKVITTIGQDIPKAAKIAGVEVDKFRKIFAETPEQAILLFAQGLQKNKSSFEEISVAFKDAGEDGVRVISTLAALGQKSEFFSGKIAEAGNALRDTTAITNAFELKNKTAGAELDKFRKNIASVFSSGTFQQAGEAAIKLMNGFINMLKGSAQFIREHGGLIAALSAIYILATKSIEGATIANIKNAVATRAKLVLAALERTITAASIAAQLIYANVVDLVTKRVTLAAAAQRIWNTVTALGAGPLGIVLVAAGALVIGVEKLLNRTRQLTAEQRVQAEVAKRVNDSTIDQVTKINILLKTIDNENASLTNKKKAYDQLIALNPEFAKTLTLDAEGHLHGKESIDKYITSLKQKAEAEAKYSLLVEKIKEQTEQLNAVRTKSNLPNAKDLDDEDLKKKIREFAKGRDLFQTLGGIELSTLLGTDDEIKTLNDQVQKSADQNVENITNTTTTVTNAAETSNARTIASIKKQIEDLDKAFEQIDVNDKKAFDANRKQRERLQVELDKLEGKVNKGAASAAKKSENALKDLVSELKKIDEELQLVNVNDFQKDILRLDQKYDALRVRAKGNNALLLEIERLYQIERGNIIDKFQKLAAEKAAKLDEEQKKRILEIALHANDNLAKALATTDPHQEELKKQFDVFQEGKKNFNQKDKEREKEEIDALRDLHDAKLISEEEFEKGVDKIHAEHFQTRLEHGLQEFIKYASWGLDLFNAFNQIKTDKENAELDADRRRNEAKKANLERRLKGGLTTQLQYNREIDKIEREQQAKEKEARKKQFNRNKVANAAQAAIDGAGALIKTMQIFGPPFPPNVLGIVAAAVTIGTTLAKITAIATQKAPEFGKGGLLRPSGIEKQVPTQNVFQKISNVFNRREYGVGGKLNGPSHSDRSRGMPVIHPYTGEVQAYVEGEEMIGSKKTARDRRRYVVEGTPSQIYSVLNGVNGGAQWTTGAVLRPAWSTKRPAQMNVPAIKKYYATGGQFHAANVIRNNSQPEEDIRESNAMLSQLNDTMLLMRGTISDLQKTVATVQRKGIRSKVVISDIEDQQDRIDKIRDDATLKP